MLGDMKMCMGRSLIQKINMKRVSIAILLLFLLVFQAEEIQAKDDQLSTVHHVYIDDQYIGKVTDRSLIEDTVKEKLKKAEEKYNGLALETDKQISYIPEQVFRANAANKDVLAKVEENIGIQTNAATIVVDGDKTVFVKDEQEAKEVLEKLKLSFASKKELAAVEKRKHQSTEELSPLTKNSERILDIQFKEDISIVSKKIKPEKVMSVADAVESLQKGTLEGKKYKVVKGDSIEEIAKKHHLTVATLQNLNPQLKKDKVLKSGQKLHVTKKDPLIHVIVKKEKYKEKKIPYKKEVVKNNDMYKGDTKVKQKGKEGKKAFTYVITKENGMQQTKNVTNEKVIAEPVTHIVEKGTKPMPSRGSGKLTWPANGGKITSKMGQRWGRMHKGIDIAGPSSYEIKAADNGVVTSARYSNGYGNKVVIDHNNGFRTVYAHLKSISVDQGQKVTKGSQIGIMGSTGRSTGTHLHFEVYKNGTLQNPLDYLQ